MAMNPRLLRPTQTGFDPRKIAGLGMWLDASDRSTLSQTSDGTTPVTADSDPVAYWKDKVTGVPLIQAIDANRPLWLADGIGGRPGLDFDGTNDVLSATSGSLMSLFRNVGAGTVITAHRLKSTTNGLEFLFFASNGLSASASRFGFARDAASVRYNIGARRLDANTAASVTSPNNSINTSSVISTVLWRVSAAQISLRLNGTASITDAAFQTAGNTSDTDSLQVAVGGVVGASVFLDFVLCEVMAWPRELTLAEMQTVERYLSNKYKITI